MLGRQERIVLIVLCMVTAIVFISSFALEITGRDSFAEPYREDSPAGSLVSLSGTVEQVSRTESGGHLILIVNRTQVFVPAGSVPVTGIAQGDSLHLLGVVQIYRGEREITVNRPADIRIQPGSPPG